MSNFTRTENGAGALKTTGNAMLDAFSSLGAMKDSSEADIISVFKKAYDSNYRLAMRLLFYIRDIRGGQGMRRVFRIILKWLSNNHKERVISNFDNILYFGRGDDILCLLKSPVHNELIKWTKSQLNKDYECYKARNGECSLLPKWMPSINTSSAETRANAKLFIDGFGWTAPKYRKFLSTMRAYIKVVEQKMSAKDWTHINYETVPAKASMIYKDAFRRHNPDGYDKYLLNVLLGKAKVNAKSLFPVDIIHRVREHLYNASATDKILYNEMWKMLPNYFEGREETGICVVDTSGSMTGTPIEVALSLGLYCADKCRGPFQGRFITFSNRPQLQKIEGETIFEKVRNMDNAYWDMNTNIEAVFELILNTAIQNKVKNENLPRKLYIISDMQFDAARRNPYGNSQPLMAQIRQKYERYGYTLPNIVYWNVRQSNCGMYQAAYNGIDCCLVSGYSPSLFKSIIEGTTYTEIQTVDNSGNITTTLKESLDPMTVMLTTLNNERYDRVVV